MKPYIFVAWCNSSDAGKDLVADIISSYIQCTKIKFSRAFKTPLEQWLNIPNGSLDDKEFRSTLVRNPVTDEEEVFNHNELMYHFFHQFKQLYPSGDNWFVPGATKQVILNTPGNMCIVDCRNKNTELELLRRLQDKYDIVLLHIVSDRGEQKSTDKDICLDDWDFLEQQYLVINNKANTLVNLEEQIGKILYQLNLI